MCSKIDSYLTLDIELFTTTIQRGFRTWIRIGWRLCWQPIRSQVWNLLSINIDVNMAISCWLSWKCICYHGVYWWCFSDFIVVSQNYPLITGRLCVKNVWGENREAVSSIIQIGKWMDDLTMRKFKSCASIHKADGCPTARSREASKPRDSGLDFSNRSEIWQAPRQQQQFWVSTFHVIFIHLRKVIVKLNFVIDDLAIFCEIALRSMLLNLTDDNSAYIQIVASLGYNASSRWFLVEHHKS